jgi:hypothetical protein
MPRLRSTVGLPAHAHRTRFCHPVHQVTSQSQVLLRFASLVFLLCGWIKSFCFSASGVMSDYAGRLLVLPVSALAQSSGSPIHLFLCLARTVPWLASLTEPWRPPPDLLSHRVLDTAGSIFVVHDFHHLILCPMSGSRVVFATCLGVSRSVPAAVFRSGCRPVEIIKEESLLLLLLVLFLSR